MSFILFKKTVIWLAGLAGHPQANERLSTFRRAIARAASRWSFVHSLSLSLSLCAARERERHVIRHRIGGEMNKKGGL